jgi:hypothetical protein
MNANTIRSAKRSAASATVLCASEKRQLFVVEKSGKVSTSQGLLREGCIPYIIIPPSRVISSIKPLMTPRISTEFLLVKDSGYMRRI